LHKTYHVQIDAVIDEAKTQAIERGVIVDGGYLRAHRCRLLRSGKKNCWIEITLDEGKNRQIRRLLAGLDLRVLRLVRVAIGPLQLGTLRKAAHRSLTSEEKAALDRAMEESERARI
jgi:23S rRNA pseudouridine2605 synthase